MSTRLRAPVSPDYSRIDAKAAYSGVRLPFEKHVVLGKIAASRLIHMTYADGSGFHE